LQVATAWTERIVRRPNHQEAAALNRLHATYNVCRCHAVQPHHLPSKTGNIANKEITSNKKTPNGKEDEEEEEEKANKERQTDLSQPFGVECTNRF
jgi:hypothetical protein